MYAIAGGFIVRGSIWRYGECLVRTARKFRIISIVTRGGSRGGVSGVATPPNGPSPTYTMQYYSTAWCAGALIYIAKSIIVSLVCSEQGVKPHSRQTVVKPEVFAFFSDCY
jgi:hypothetical protein